MKKIILVLATVVLFGSCAREISSDVYYSGTVGEASLTYAGTVLNAKPVTVRDAERLEENGLGMVGGGLAGAFAGSYVGKGTGNTLASVGGAILGATAGAAAERSIKTQSAIEYVVQLDNGNTMTIVQGPNPAYSIGQPIYVIVSTQHKGRSRIIAR